MRGAEIPALERNGPATVPRVSFLSLGESAETISPIGVGLAAIGRPGYINIGHGRDLAGRTDERSMEEHAHAVLDAAYAAGVRYFDAARSYGKAEAFLASWLARPGLGAQDVIVGSKWGYTYTADWRVDADVHEVKDLSLATLCRQLQESRALLGAHLRLYQIHSATLESGVLEDPAVLEELQRLRGGGLRIGFTVTGPRQAETIERGLAVGLFDAVQATWNLFERSAGDPLARAHEAGLAVIVKEALANGRLTGAGDAALLTDLAADAEVTPDALALAAALAQPWADIVLSGASTPEQLNSNVAATRVQLSQDMLERLDALREDPASYWETRAALPWN